MGNVTITIDGKKVTVPRRILLSLKQLKRLA